MITDIAPTGSTTNQSLQGQHLIGLTLNGNGIAGGGVHVATVKDSEFGQIYCTGFNGGTGPGSKPCVNFDVVHSTSTNFGEGCDNLRLNIYDITGYQVGFTSDIVQYNAWINTGIPNSGCGNSYNTITRISGLVQNSDIFAQYGGDNNRTVGMSGAVVSGTGRMLYVGVASNIDPGTGLTKVNGTNSEIYDHISIGPIVVAGTATGCAITPGVLGMCPTGLQFRNLDASNGAGNPTLGAGIRPMVDVIWDFNNNTAQPWAAWAPTLTCESGSPGSYTVSGANFFKRGGTVSFSVRLTLGTLTGCTGGQVLTAPPGAAITNLTGNLSGTISCYDFNNGAVGTGYIDGGTNLIHTRWAGVQPGSNDIIGCGGVYASN
jgi:hypothetical protein